MFSHSIQCMRVTLSEPLLAPTPPRLTLRSERIDLLDNAKAVLIFFVVFYHTTVVFTSADRPEVRTPIYIQSTSSACVRERALHSLYILTYVPRRGSRRSPSGPASLPSSRLW